MKKIIGMIVVLMLAFSCMTYAGGDQVCGDKAAGPAGDTGEGDTTRNRAPNP